MNRQQRRRLARQEAKGPVHGAVVRQTTLEQALGLALQHHQSGRFAEAERICLQILQAQPTHPDAWNNLGMALRNQNRLDEAIECYQHVLRLKPDFAEAYNNLGIALRAQKRLEEAAGCYSRALSLKPDYVTACSNLGSVLLELGRADDAVTALRHALTLDPFHADALNNLGLAYRSQGRFEEARECLQAALAANPKSVKALTNLGLCLHLMDDTREAERRYAQALTLEPQNPLALELLGNVLLDQGKRGDARVCYRQALSLAPKPGLRVKLAAALIPRVPASWEQIRQSREAFGSELRQLTNSGLSLQDPAAEVGCTSFYLAYQGLNDRELQEDIARFYTTACPGLSGETPPGLAERLSDAGARRLRIGFLSAFLRHHTIGKLNRGLIERLCRDRFQVTVLQAGRRDAVADRIAESADRAVRLSGSLARWREQVAAEDLDLLFYTDIGMDPQSYYLAFARLAPVQCVSWGHPVTTGLPSIDYFVSSNLLEPEGAEAHYSERLARLSVLPTCYYRPEAGPAPAARDVLGFEKDWRLYVCPQSLFKMHPEFDAVLAEILRRDPKGRVVFTGGRVLHFQTELTARIVGRHPETEGRLLFTHRLDERAFMTLLACADVLLDPLYFGGGNTTYEAFSIGAPIVTWPGPFMRGRVTAAAYARMGITDALVPSPEGYAERAVALACDRDWRADLGSRILERSHVLYEDRQAVDELGRFFEAAVTAAARGTVLEGWTA